MPPKEAADGYAEQYSDGCEMIDLHVLCVNGSGCKFTIPSSSLDREVRRMVLERLPPKRGARLALQYLASPLVLSQTFQEQGVAGQAATLSCTFVPTDLYAAYRDLGFAENICFSLRWKIHDLGDIMCLFCWPQGSQIQVL